MPRMDPDFAAIFSKDYPEAYGEALRNRRRRNASPSASTATTIHVPLVPPLVSRFMAGLVVMLLLIGAFFVISQTTDNRTLGIPSGQDMSSSAGSTISGAKLTRNVAEIAADKGKPLQDVSKGFERNLTH